MKRLLSLSAIFLFCLAASADSKNELLKSLKKAREFQTCVEGDEECIAPSQATAPDPEDTKLPVISKKDAKPKSAATASQAPDTQKPLGEFNELIEFGKTISSKLRYAMRVQTEFLQRAALYEPKDICEKFSHLCESYKRCLKTAEEAFENSRRRCALPSQADGVEFDTPHPVQRERMCMGVVLAADRLLGKRNADGAPMSTKPGTKSKMAEAPELNEFTADEPSDVAKDADTAKRGDHAEGTRAGREISSSSEPVYEACGEEKSPLTPRMENGKLLPHSVYQITVRAKDGKWIPSQSGDDTECLRILTDQHGGIRGKMMLSGTAPDKTVVRSRFLGRQLPNPDGKLHPNRVYDAFTLPGGKQRFIFAACENQTDLRKPLISLVQTAPGKEKEAQLVGLKFVGEKSDPRKKLAFVDAAPWEVIYALPTLFKDEKVMEQNQLKQESDAVSMAAFVEDK